MKQPDADKLVQEAKRLRTLGADLRARLAKVPPDSPEAAELRVRADYAEDAARLSEQAALNIAAGPVPVKDSETLQNSAKSRARRLSRNGRGVRANILPEGDKETAWAKVEALRARKAARP